MKMKLLFCWWTALVMITLTICTRATMATIARDHEVDGQGIYRLRERKEKRSIPVSDYEELKIFCHEGKGPEIASFWSSVEMRLRIDNDDYDVYMAENSSMVQAMHDKHKASWFYSGLPWKSKSMKMNPFENGCVGVLTKRGYTMSLQKYRVNYWQVVMTFAGIALFYYAPSLCRNVFFHYTTGVAAGVFLSLLVISYFIQRKFNLGKWALACYSLSVYFLTSIWYNIKLYFMDNFVYVLGYLVCSALISFAVCYRMGPVENPRTVNLIQWTLQLVALVIIYLSSYHQVASLGLALVIVGWFIFPNAWKTKLQVQYQRKFVRPKICLLTETEYFDQSRVETEKALRELREFCQSPKCDAWKVTSALRSPTRFAEFVHGTSHLTQDEVMDYSLTDFDDRFRILNDADSNGIAADDGQLQLTDDDSSDRGDDTDF